MKHFYFLILFAALLFSCASYQKNIKHIRKNPNEIVQFKQYLETKYKLDSIKEYETIWGNINTTDTVIKKFCSENNILSIVKHPKDEEHYFYNKYGNIVQLYFQHIVFVENNQSIIFDYTENGLENYDPAFARYKVADRIYIFNNH